MTIALRILHLEDSPKDAELVQAMLEQDGFACEVTRVETRDNFFNAHQHGSFDLIFADYTLPSFDGLSALAIAREHCPHIPFIFVTGTLGEEVAIEALKQGATDYVLKQRLSRLVPVVHRALRESMERAERNRAEQEVRRNLERIRALHQIDVAIGSTLDLHAVLNILMEKLDRFFPYPLASTVGLINKETGLIESMACRNIEEEEWRIGQSRPIVGRTGEVIKSRAPLTVRNLLKDPRSRNPDFYIRNNLVSYAGVPLIAKDEVLGVLVIHTRSEHDFSSEEIDFLTTLAGQAAIAINNAQLYDAATSSRKELELTNQYLEKTSKQLSGLYTALSPLMPFKSIHEMIDGIIERLMEATGADAALVRVKDDSKTSFPIVSQHGFPDAYLNSVRSLGPGGAADWVFNHNEAIIAPDVASEARFRAKIQLQVGLRSAAMLPFKIHGEVRGIIHLSSRKLGHFDEEQKEYLEAIARQMGIALENKELFDSLKKSRDELEKANKIKDEFLSVMSHELRTPLNVVVGYAGMIRDGLLGEVNPQQAEALDKVIKRTNDQLAMINNVLYATVLETEKISVDSHEINVSDFLRQVSLGYQAPINKDIKLTWDYPTDLPIIRTDSAKLKQMLHNLIDNAIKFTDKGSVTISAAGAGGKWVEFTVADTGVGIPKEHLPYIFDKFQQVDSSETRLYGGVGMGLYIVKKFTELLGGSVEVESEVGIGSTFTVRLPVLRS